MIFILSFSSLHSGAIIRKNAEKSTVSFYQLYLIISCKTTVQNSIQGADMAAAEIQNISTRTSIFHAAFLWPHLLLLTHTSLLPVSYSSGLHFYSFVISRMLHKWNQIVCNLWSYFFPQCDSRDSYTFFHIDSVSSLLLPPGLEILRLSFISCHLFSPLLFKTQILSCFPFQLRCCSFSFLISCSG